jgi:hypothetical protein
MDEEYKRFLKSRIEHWQNKIQEDPANENHYRMLLVENISALRKYTLLKFVYKKRETKIVD